MKPTIDKVFPDRETNEHLIKMFQIINYRRLNPIKWYRTEYRTADYIYNELHHIIPRSYCKYHGFEIDNSNTGTIRLRFAEHILVHVYLKQYFLERQDYNVAYANAKTIQYMCGKNQDYINKINGINQEEQNQILLQLQQNSEGIAAAAKHQFNNMTPLEKQKYRKQCSERIHKFWNEMPDKQRIQIGKNISERLNNRSQTEKDIQYSKMRKTKQNWTNEMKQRIANYSSAISSKTWASYSPEERQRRCNNISKGTKNAMAKIPAEIKAEYSKRAAKTLSENCKKRSVKRKQELHIAYGKYHIGAKAMSNDQTHHWRYVSVNEQQEYLNNGYVFGNHSKEWLKQGMVKLSKGHYGFI